MTSTFIPTLGRHPLYCVWLETGNPSRPLACVWIDPELRTFQFPDVESVASTREKTDEHEPDTLAERFIPASQRRDMKTKTRLTLRPLSWVSVVFCLLNAAWADVAGKISGMVNDPSGVLVDGATATLNNAGGGIKHTTTTNDQGQYSVPGRPG